MFNIYETAFCARSLSTLVHNSERRCRGLYWAVSGSARVASWCTAGTRHRRSGKRKRHHTSPCAAWIHSPREPFVPQSYSLALDSFWGVAHTRQRQNVQARARRPMSWQNHALPTLASPSDAPFLWLKRNTSLLTSYVFLVGILAIIQLSKKVNSYSMLHPIWLCNFLLLYKIIIEG